MGVVRRQTIKSNLVSLVAVGVAAWAQLYLYTENLELKGYADALIKWAFLFGPMLTLGAQVIIIRFLPYSGLDKAEAAQRLLGRALLLITTSLLVTAGLLYFAGNAFFDWFSARGYDLGRLASDRWKIFFALAGFEYSVLLTAHVSNFQRIAVPEFFNNLLLKILGPLLFAGAVYGVYQNQYYVYGFVAMYWVVTLGLIGYSLYLGVFRPSLKPLKLRGKKTRDVVSMAAFSVFVGIGSALATHLDVVMVNTLISDAATAVYNFSVFATVAVMIIPYKAINVMTAPLVAKAWEARDLPELQRMYRESSSVTFYVSGLIFAGAVVCLPPLYELTEGTGQYAVAYRAAVILGLAQVIEQATSINGLLITYTDSYRWNLVFTTLLGVLNLALNYYFIATLDLGLTGAALATLVSLTVYNLCKLIFVYRRTGLYPMGRSWVWTPLVIAGAVGLGLLVPFTKWPVFTIMLRGTLVCLVFAAYGGGTRVVGPVREVFKTLRL